MNLTSDTHCYTVTVSGMPDADFLSSYCPAGVTLTVQGEIAILANLHTDQAGLMGLLRSLQNLGCTLLSLSSDVGGNL